MIRALVLVALTAASCTKTERERCAQCGMFVDIAPRWMAGLGEQKFDAPKCLFQWAPGHGQNPSEGWVTEYYTQTRRDIRSVSFVIGSDVTGPMGADLVPIAGGERAAQFASDHGGRVIAPGDIDSALLRSLSP